MKKQTRKENTVPHRESAIMTIFVSACLLGVCCRYDGQNKPNRKVIGMLGKHTLIPVCPEVFGGLKTPRLPAERIGARIICKDGTDVTENYVRGAEEVLKLAKLYNCRLAILKERSPSCGNGSIYDGSFGGVLTDGDGVLAALLKATDIEVIGESDCRIDML